MARRSEEGELRCSFCNKTQREVKKLVAGPTTFICDECVMVCLEIVEADLHTESGIPFMIFAVRKGDVELLESWGRRVSVSDILQALEGLDQEGPISSFLQGLNAYLIPSLKNAQRAELLSLEAQIMEIDRTLDEAMQARVRREQLIKKKGALEERLKPQQSGEAVASETATRAE